MFTIPKKSISILLLCTAVCGCYIDDDSSGYPNFPVGQVEGYRPIYAKNGELGEIKMQPAKPLVAGGKIYTLNNLLLMASPGLGIHIIDNTDPTLPVNKGFIAIKGNADVAIKGQTMYADQYSDLLVFDISDIESIKLVKRINHVFKNAAQKREVPPRIPDAGPYTYFECADPSQGLVIGWELATLNNPTCFL